MSSELTLILGLACGLPLLLLVVAVVASAFGPRATAARRLRKMEATEVGALRDGALVKVRGRARVAPENLLVAPVSGRRAIAYEITMTYRSGSTIRGPIAIAQATSFTVEDETGEASVDGAGAQVLASRAHQAEVQAEDAPDWMIERLAQDGLALNRDKLTGRFILEEGVLAPDASVTVLGRARIAPLGGYRDRAALAADADEGLVIDAS